MFFLTTKWRTYKYECFYLREIKSLKEDKEVGSRRVEYYNKERLHQARDYRTPDEVYYGKETSTMNDKILTQN
ncbi:integrase core domain-containing protein [Persephonella sp.]